MKKEKKNSIGAFRKQKLIFIWGGLSIPLIFWIVQYWYVNFSSFIIAFQDMATGDFSLVNFEAVIESIKNPYNSKESLAYAFKNTLIYFSVDMFVKFPLQILLCYFLYKQIYGYKFFRLVLFLPAIVPGIAMTAVFKEVIAPNGPLQQLGVNVPLQGYLGSADTATNTIVVFTIWTCLCGNMLLICGAMHRIPIDVLEAARIEGIGPGRELISLIIPLIWPTLSTLFLLSCCGFLSASGPILLLAPDSYSLGTTTISYWLFDKIYQGGSPVNGKYNLVSAAGLFLTLIALPVTLGIRKLMEKLPSSEY